MCLCVLFPACDRFVFCLSEARLTHIFSFRCLLFLFLLTCVNSWRLAQKTNVNNRRSPLRLTRPCSDYLAERLFNKEHTVRKQLLTAFGTVTAFSVVLVLAISLGLIVRLGNQVCVWPKCPCDLRELQLASPGSRESNGYL